MAYSLFIKPRAGSVSSNAFKLHNEKERQPSRYRSCPDDNRSTCQPHRWRTCETGTCHLGSERSCPCRCRYHRAYQIIGMIDDTNPERASLEFAGYEVLGGRETLDSLWERQV